jgi:hypothetical protein
MKILMTTPIALSLRAETIALRMWLPDLRFGLHLLLHPSRESPMGSKSGTRASQMAARARLVVEPLTAEGLWCGVLKVLKCCRGFVAVELLKKLDWVLFPNVLERG